MVLMPIAQTTTNEVIIGRIVPVILAEDVGTITIRIGVSIKTQTTIIKIGSLLCANFVESQAMLLGNATRFSLLQMLHLRHLVLMILLNG